MIRVTPRARRREDQAGDPLDGLVNLFDLGIVLAVAFLLAALSSLNLTGTLSHGLKPVAPQDVKVVPGETIHTVPTTGATAVGPGEPVGTVYRLPSGELVYVTGTQTPAPGITPTPGTPTFPGPTTTPGVTPTTTPTAGQPSATPTATS